LKYETSENLDATEKLIKIEAAILENDSPYAEVRAVVEPFDNFELPVSTFRAWSIGRHFLDLELLPFSSIPND
jgi:hypothetical protein